MPTYINFPDKCVSYEIFMDDLASRIVRKMQRAKDEPERISQRRAYAIFGRGNVDRWRRKGMITPCKRPGKVEYIMADLRLLQQTQQDYFNR